MAFASGGDSEELQSLVDGRNGGARRQARGPRFEVLFKGRCAALRVSMKKGERIKAESDALVSKSDNVALAGKLEGGLLKGLARMCLAGETLFFQTLTATGDDADVLLSSPTGPGDIVLAELNGREGYMLRRGAFLAAEPNVDVQTTTQLNLKKTLFGPGFFILRARGYGTLALHCYGSTLVYALAAGERRTVDNGHVVAWTAGMRYRVGLATTGWVNSVTSGEGMMCHFEGPGTVYVQSHAPSPLAARAGAARRSGPAGKVLALCVVCTVLCMFFLFIVAVVWTANKADGGGGGVNVKWGSGGRGRG